MEESIGLEGRITVYAIPEWTDAELRYFWLPETALGEDGLYHIVRPARISDAEKEQRTLLETKNLITQLGFQVLTNNIGAPSQNGATWSLDPFAQIFSVGNGAITYVLRQDTAVAGDGFATGSRKVPAAFSIVGLTTTITTNFGSGDAVGTITNCGFYGTQIEPFGTPNVNATTTAGSGWLMSHALLSLVKGSSAVAIAYSFTIANPH